MASPRPPLPPPSPPFDLQITILAAKHLKNINWRHGDLKPYAVVYLDPAHRLSTNPDDHGSTKPVWNQTLTLPIPLPSTSLFLSIDILHSKPPNPLAASHRSPLKDLIDILAPSARPIDRTLPLFCASGRPQGKIRIKLALTERPYAPPEPNYHNYYYSSAPPSTRDYHNLSPPIPPQYPYGGYSDPYYTPPSGYYPGNPIRGYYERGSGYGGPSAPVDYSYVKHEKERFKERVESDFAPRDDYSDYRGDY